MNEYANVTVVRKANVYFGGAVTSRTILFPDGSKKTLGIIQPGEYRFDTAAAELMEILAGDTEVRVGAAGEWRTVRGGESFEVPANSSFVIRANSLTDYCCSFMG